jgi:hypothetical protein
MNRKEKRNKRVEKILIKGVSVGSEVDGEVGVKG